MNILTLNDVSRLDRVFHNVVNAINRAKLPDLMLRETKKFSIEGGTIKSLVDDSDARIVSLVDEMRFDQEHQKFVPTDTITIYASKYLKEQGIDDRIVPVRKWEIDPEATTDIAFVIAYFFLGHNHLLNRHFSSDNLRDAFMISQAKRELLIGVG